MLSLNDREWKEFRLEDLFSVKRPTARNKDDYDDGNICFVASGAVNNGVMKCCAPKGGEKLDAGNCLTVSPVDGSCFYQPQSFLGRGGAGSSILMLYPVNWNLNRYIGEFISKTVNMTATKYSYGHMANGESIKRDRIMLPVNPNGQPDYDFMEAYIRQQEQDKVDAYIQYCKSCLSELGSETNISEITQKEWLEFFVDDIFTIDSGKRLESYNMTAGSRPFIGATDSGNGVTNYISNENESLDSNVLGVNYNGNGMVISFYHPYECLFSDDVKRFHLKNHSDNKYVLLFFKTLILQQKAKYNYGYKFNATRMKRQKIMIPVTESGEPDYDYMAQYAKNMMIRKYQQYLDYYENAKT